MQSRDELRYTPAGIPAIDCTLQHASMQMEAGGERRVECELFAVAFDDVARTIARTAVNARAGARSRPSVIPRLRCLRSIG